VLSVGGHDGVLKNFRLRGILAEVTLAADNHDEGRAYMPLFTQIFLGVLVIVLGARLWLAGRQGRHVRRHRDAVPAAFVGHVPLVDHQKAADYTLAKLRLGRLELLLGAVLLVGWTLGGGLNHLDQWALATGWGAVAQGLVFFALYGLISALIDLPLDIHRVFRLEQRFGFNRMTWRLFLADMLKGLVLGVLLGGPLAALVLWLMQDPDPLWWLYVWAVWFGFSLLMMWAFPRFIAPLFNKFVPLDDETLKARIVTLLQKCGFHSEGVFVMDGSKRSAHGNAYFTGMGASKRIVFFDTLLKSLSPSEVEAVLAHELGHFRLHHVRKRLITTALMSLGALAVLGWLYDQHWFYQGLGVDRASPQAALLLFMMVGPLFAFLLQPLMAFYSRKHEFEADAFAVQMSDKKSLVSALVKLYQENASTLTPDPLYSTLYDSHPPAPIRIAHIQQSHG
jgi:STE24 endopeptidase